MSVSFNVRRDEPLEEGTYRAFLKRLEEKETSFGERILWLFEVSEHNAEEAGFTSLSGSSRHTKSSATRTYRNSKAA